MDKEQLEHKKTYLEHQSGTYGLAIGANRSLWSECKQEFKQLPNYCYLYVKTGDTTFGSPDGTSIGMAHKDVKDLHEYLGQIIQYMEDK